MFDIRILFESEDNSDWWKLLCRLQLKLHLDYFSSSITILVNIKRHLGQVPKSKSFDLGTIRYFFI